jgi:3-oxoadipate enol-lactonase
MADAVERGTMRDLVEGSMGGAYPVTLRTDASRFESFRARWLGVDPGSFAATYRMLAALDLDEGLKRIACPVVLVAGTLDGFRPPAFVHELAAKIPGAQVKEIESGHFAAYQTPELVAHILNQFLTELSD